MANICSTKERCAMHRAWSILLVSQQDIDHVYSAIVPIMQSLYGSFQNTKTAVYHPKYYGSCFKSGISLQTRSPAPFVP